MSLGAVEPSRFVKYGVQSHIRVPQLEQLPIALESECATFSRRRAIDPYFGHNREVKLLKSPPDIPLVKYNGHIGTRTYEI